MAGGFVDEERAKAALIADGIISEKLINELEKTALIQEAVGDHYDVTEVRGGKLGLKQKHSHGMSNHRDNLNALLMAIDSEMNGRGLLIWADGRRSVSYTHLTLPTNREV